MDNQNYAQTIPENQDLFQVTTPQFAGFWQRFAAVFLDGLILAIPNWLLTSAVPELMGSFISIILAWLYYALQESGKMQATLGKRALGIKVVNEQGEQITFGQASGRHFGKIVSTIILFIGYLMMLWDKKSQTLHDKMAETYVVENRPMYV